MTRPGQASIVGVIICLCANVIISLALNVQKLAHMQQQQHSDKHNEHSDDALTLDCAPSQEAAGVVVVVDSAEVFQAAQEENVALLMPRSMTGRHGHHYGTLTPIPTSPSPSEDPLSSKPSMASTERAARKRPHSSTDQDGDQDNSGGGPTTEYLRSKLWWLGMALMLLGESGNFLSYGFAPASLVAPLGAVALLANVFISPCLLHERFQSSDLAGVALAIVGSVTVVFASKDNDVRLGPDELWEALCRKEFIIYAFVVLCLGLCLAWASTTRWGEKWVLLDVGACATAGGATVLSTKGLSSLLSGGRNLEIFRYPITYGLVVVLAVTAVIQLTFLTSALQRFDSRVVIPTQFVLFTFSAITGAAVLFRDFEDVDLHRLINFCWGCAALFAGVFILTCSYDEDDDSSDAESTSSLDRNGVPVDLYLPTVSESRTEDASVSTPAAQRGQAARPASFGRRSSGRNRPAIPTSITTTSVPFWNGAVPNASFTTTASATAWPGRTPKRGFVALAPATGGLSQGTYLLMGTSPGNSSRDLPSRARSLSQPSTPTRRRSRQNLRAPDAAMLRAESTSRCATRRRSTDLESGSRDSSQDAS